MDLGDLLKELIEPPLYITGDKAIIQQEGELKTMLEEISNREVIRKREATWGLDKKEEWRNEEWELTFSLGLEKTWCRGRYTILLLKKDR